MEACHKIVGFPEKDTIVMTGATFSVAKREKYWKEKRVFFLTPQIVKNDIQNGALCLIFLSHVQGSVR